MKGTKEQLEDLFKTLGEIYLPQPTEDYGDEFLRQIDDEN
jgi:hypothetical protein